MKALVFNPLIPRYVVTKALEVIKRQAMWGRFAPLQYRDIPEPRLPGEDWVRVAVRLGGICGSDLHAIHLDASFSTSAYTSFPFVMGHENVGTIVEAGRAVTGLALGQRVVVEPVLPCAARGFAAPCPNCAAGRYNLCLRYTEGHVSPGLMIGYCRDTGGSWGPSFVAHQSQVFPISDEISEENALLSEPAACAVHALVQSPPPDRATVLVIGGGVMGQCTIAALRAMHSDARVVALVKYPFQGEMARRLGADEVVPVARGDGHYAAIADIMGGTLRRPMIGKRVLIGGADLTIECVGSSRGIDDALRLTRPGGTVIPLGLPAVPFGVDWTMLWLKELHVLGSYVYQVEEWEGRRVRTLQLVLEWMAKKKLDLGHLVTHRYPLAAYAHALNSATGKAQSHAFKVVFTPNS